MTVWCVVIMRKLTCTIVGTGESIEEPDVVSVYGPFTKQQAEERVNQFNLVHDEADDGAPRYRPVSNAPKFLHSEEWQEYWAISRPLNDIIW